MFCIDFNQLLRIKSNDSLNKKCEKTQHNTSEEHVSRNLEDLTLWAVVVLREIIDFSRVLLDDCVFVSFKLRQSLRILGRGRKMEDVAVVQKTFLLSTFAHRAGRVDRNETSNDRNAGEDTEEEKRRERQVSLQARERKEKNTRTDPDENIDLCVEVLDNAMRLPEHTIKKTDAVREGFIVA